MAVGEALGIASNPRRAESKGVLALTTTDLEVSAVSFSSVNPPTRTHQIKSRSAFLILFCRAKQVMLLVPGCSVWQALTVGNVSFAYLAKGPATVCCRILQLLITGKLTGTACCRHSRDR